MSDLLNAKKLFENGIKEFTNNNFIEAKQSFKDALKFAPKRISILENLALVHFIMNEFEDAEIALKKIGNLGEHTDKSFEIMINSLRKHGKIPELKSFIEDEQKKKKLNPKYHILKEFLYPNFFSNNQEIISSRENLLNSIKKLEKIENIKLNLDTEIIDPPIFSLSYDQYENLEVNKKIVNLYRKFYPELNYVNVIKKKNNKIQIGFASEYFTTHTIGKLYIGLILKLDGEKFNVHIFHSQNTNPSFLHSKFLEAEINHNIKNHTLPKNFQDKINLIKNQNLDILFFPEIGMSSEFYFLSYIRFCDNQITSWGHPMTTGNKSIDFFLSSKLLETNNSQKKYSEKLILSEYLPMYFYKPILKNQLEDKDLSEQNIYFCPQTLIKIHPNFDEILKKILQNDSKAKIIFIKDGGGILAKKLMQRFKKTISNNLGRIDFINKMKINDYINYCGKASVLLDPLYFGAGNSFHESMYYGTPTITMPTDNIKSRIVLGAYKQMEIKNSPIVKNIDDYVSSAIEIANLKKNTLLETKKYYRECADKKLFKNERFIAELENIFLKLVN
jgi:protein O-GlcNAc transferase